MDESLERLRGASQAGNIDALYAVIQDDADVFQRIDQMRFVDTPLHVAAAAGHADFAMEIMNLNPSFARKLNQRGLSPIHLALQNQQNEMVIDLLSIDKDLVRVKGREGYTALHVVAGDGNVLLLSQFLDHCPDCILDLTIRKETALHIAAQNNRLEALKAMLKFIRRNIIFLDYHIRKKGILNLQDKDGNTALHIAASNNHPQMIKLLIKCKEIRNMANESGLTALDVLLLQTQVDNRESVNILRSAKYSTPSRFFESSSFRRKLTRDIEEMKPETTNALLVVFALFLSMTYQALLSPPGSVFQADASSNSTANNQNVGKSVMGPFDFLFFFVPNCIAFSMAMIITLSLISVVAKSIKSFMVLLDILMSLCYGAALSAIGPEGFSTAVASLIPVLFVLCIYLPALHRFKKH